MKHEHKIQNIEGLTLLEVIIAITLLAVIASAGFYGMQYAFYTMSSAGEYAGEVYDRQQEFEGSLSYEEGNVPFDPALGYDLEDDYINDNPAYTVAFLEAQTGLTSGSYSIVNYTWTGTTNLDNFNCHGVTYQEDAEGGSYLSDPLYVLIPTNTVEVP